MESISGAPAIPTVDISAFLNPDSSEEARQAVVEGVSSACHVYGFFNLTGHGISKDALEEALELNKMFFALPQEKKMEVWINKSVGRSFRGYEPPGIQTHQQGLLPDTKEVRFKTSHYAGSETLNDTCLSHRRSWSAEKSPRMIPTAAASRPAQTCGLPACPRTSSRTASWRIRAGCSS